MITAATLFSGIGSPECAMPSWDWRWCAEIEKFPCAVLAARHPQSVNLGNVTADDFCERAAAVARPDVIVFGSPCQAFSIAGKRLGLDDARGNLALVALRIIARLAPRWFVFENVPGLFSSFSGSEHAERSVREGPVGGQRDCEENRDFAAFLSRVHELRYSLAWTVLDAQYRGVAQRRERVFAVGHFGDWRGPAAVLLEPQGLRGDTPPRREARQEIAGAIGKCLGAGGHGTNPLDENLITHALRADGFDASEDGTGRGTPLVAFDCKAGGNTNVGTAAMVRRLLPLECERLQGLSEIRRTVRICVWPSSDLQKKAALAESQNPKSPSSVLNADDSELTPHAKCAERHSTINHQSPDLPVVAHVLIDLERQVLQLSSPGKSNWCASIVERPSSSPLLMPIENFARFVVRMSESAALLIMDGKAASQASTNHFLPRWSGNGSVHLYGREIAALAADAEQFTTEEIGCTKSTTSGVGQNSQNSAAILQIWSSSVLLAISSFIPSEIRTTNSYAVIVETVSGYTAITYRGKPAADGNRYKAIGNSMAVPVIRWILERVEFVDGLISIQQSGAAE